MLHGLCAFAGLLVVVVLADIIYQVISGASPAISRFGLNFIGYSRWAPNFGVFGAAAAIYGTLLSSLMALVLATPLGIAIGLYLSTMAPPAVRAVVGPLVEMLAAIPSVIVGFWGFAVLAPFAAQHLEPFFHGVLGFIPLFGTPQSSGASIFTAGLGLTLMVLPIIAALSRDLFLTVPQELTDGAALGEAIAVTQMIGDGAGIHSSTFLPGISLASRIANEFNTPENKLQIPSLFYLALILLVIGLMTSLLARTIAGRFDVARTLISS
jgi:phosphate transport system permease protein